MPTKIGYLGQWNYHVGGNTELNHVPISTKSNTGHGWNPYPDVNYRGYYTINQPQLQLDADEYPTKITFSDYSPYIDGVQYRGTWKDNNYDTMHSTTVTVGLFGGNISVLPNSVYDFMSYSLGYHGEAQITGTWDIPDNIGKQMIGQKMNLRLANGGSQLWGYCKVTITTLKHEIIWTNPSLSFSQNEYVLTVTKGGSARDSWGGTPTYDLHMDGAYLATFSGNSISFTLTDDQLEVPHTFALYAISTANGRTIVSAGKTTSHTPHSVHKTMKYRDGTTWVECYANVRDGSTWVEVEPFYWDGTVWVPCSQT